MAYQYRICRKQICWKSESFSPSRTGRRQSCFFWVLRCSLLNIPCVARQHKHQKMKNSHCAKVNAVHFWRNCTKAMANALATIARPFTIVCLKLTSSGRPVWQPTWHKNTSAYHSLGNCISLQTTSIKATTETFP